MKSRLALAGLATCSLTLTCSSPRLEPRSSIGSQAPDGTLRMVDDVPVNGAQVDVELIDMPNTSGELLAVEGGYLYLRVDGFIRKIPLSQIHEVEVQLEPGVGGWGVVGAVSTLSHGFWLVFSLPVWVGSTVAAGQATESYVSDQGLTQLLYQYARFPQGMPKGYGFAAPVPPPRDAPPAPTSTAKPSPPEVAPPPTTAPVVVPPPPPQPLEGDGPDAGGAGDASRD